MNDQSNLNVEHLFNKDALVESDKATVQNGEWMSLQDASNKSGLSMGTLRRYIKARKLKSRRLGRSINAKLEVWVTPDLMPEETNSGDVFEFDGEIDDHASDEDDQIFGDRDHTDQSDEQTLVWMRRKLDEKDALLREKDSKIERLAHELTGATYRNGYLEAEKSMFEEKLLLLEDKAQQTLAQLHEEPVAPVEPPKKWSQLSKWFFGK
jgi:hypothetical protein